MKQTRAKGSRPSVVEQLEQRGVVRGILVQMAKDGQLVELRCEMPSCYCPERRRYFDAKKNPMPDWALNVDHYPKLKMDGGTRRQENVRLAHVLCNNRDYAWRKNIKEMLAARMSLKDIAIKLKQKKVEPPHNRKTWTARMVRKAYVS
jgi:hypothetical protein